MVWKKIVSCTNSRILAANVRRNHFAAQIHFNFHFSDVVLDLCVHGRTVGHSFLLWGSMRGAALQHSRSPWHRAFHGFARRFGNRRFWAWFRISLGNFENIYGPQNFLLSSFTCDVQRFLSHFSLARKQVDRLAGLKFNLFSKITLRGMEISQDFGPEKLSAWILAFYLDTIFWKFDSNKHTFVKCQEFRVGFRQFWLRI